MVKRLRQFELWKAPGRTRSLTAYLPFLSPPPADKSRQARAGGVRRAKVVRDLPRGRQIFAVESRRNSTAKKVASSQKTSCDFLVLSRDHIRLAFALVDLERGKEAPNMDMFTAMREAAVTDQMDPMAVVEKLVELTETETTSEHNIVPADGVEELNKATGLDHTPS